MGEDDAVKEGIETAEDDSTDNDTDDDLHTRVDIWSLSAENKKPPTDRVDPLQALFYLSAASHVSYIFYYSRSGIADRFL